MAVFNADAVLGTSLILDLLVSVTDMHCFDAYSVTASEACTCFGTGTCGFSILPCDSCNKTPIYVAATLSAAVSAWAVISTRSLVGVN
jgi:hypothetical protein